MRPAILSTIFSLLALVQIPAMAESVSGSLMHDWKLADDRFLNAPAVTGKQKQFAEDVYKTAKLIGFVKGVVDSHNGLDCCVPADVETRHLVAKVERYVEFHPDDWGQPGFVLVAEAVRIPYPCTK